MVAGQPSGPHFSHKQLVLRFHPAFSFRSAQHNPAV